LETVIFFVKVYAVLFLISLFPEIRVSTKNIQNH